MMPTLKREKSPRLILSAETAAALMTTNPVSIQDVALVKEAVTFLTDKGYSAAPVIDAAGKPVGVLSRSDIVIHDREKVKHVPVYSGYSEETGPVQRAGESLESGFQVEDVDYTRVRDIMTPIVFSTTPQTPAGKVIADMLALKVHRLFVVDDAGVLIGVISAHDILRQLRPE